MISYFITFSFRVFQAVFQKTGVGRAIIQNILTAFTQAITENLYYFSCFGAFHKP